MGILCSNYDRNIRYKKVIFKHCKKCGVKYPLPINIQLKEKVKVFMFLIKREYALIVI